MLQEWVKKIKKAKKKRIELSGKKEGSNLYTLTAIKNAIVSKNEDNLMGWPETGCCQQLRIKRANNSKLYEDEHSLAWEVVEEMVNKISSENSKTGVEVESKEIFLKSWKNCSLKQLSKTNKNSSKTNYQKDELVFAISIKRVKRRVEIWKRKTSTISKTWTIEVLYKWQASRLFRIRNKNWSSKVEPRFSKDLRVEDKSAQKQLQA